MILRIAGAVLLLAAIVLYAVVARPLRREAAAAGDEYRRLRDERRVLQSRLVMLQRRESRQQSLAAAAANWRRPDVLQAARLALVRSLEDGSLTDVRLGVARASASHALAEVKLSAGGDFEDVVRASGHVVRPGSGLILGHVQMAPRPEGVTLQMEAVVPGGRP